MKGKENKGKLNMISRMFTLGDKLKLLILGVLQVKENSEEKSRRKKKNVVTKQIERDWEKLNMQHA